MPQICKYVSLRGKKALQMRLSWGSWDEKIILRYVGGPRVLTGALIIEPQRREFQNQKPEGEVKPIWPRTKEGRQRLEDGKGKEIDLL